MSEDAINIWIVATIVLLAWIARLKWSNRKLRAEKAHETASRAPARGAKIAAADGDGEVLRLRERVAVLERIAFEKENTLSREIDSLRDR